MSKNKFLTITTLSFILVLLTATPVSADTQHEQEELGAPYVFYIPPDFTPFEPINLPTIFPFILPPSEGDYFIWDDHGGWWSDADKTNTNTDDDLMCWAAACSNTMEYAGWGTVTWGTDSFISTDDDWNHYLDHWEDKTGLMSYGYQWWFEDGDPNGRVDVTGGGNFFSTLDYEDYYHETWTNSETVEFIDEMLHLGYPTSIGIRPGTTGGHAITVWGYSYSTSVDKTTNPKDHYLGLYVTDSDDDMGGTPPPNTLRYYTLDWDEDGRWELTDYGGGWWIDLVSAIEPKPGNNRPTASVATFAPVNEGSPLTLDASTSSDPDGDTIQYRWDFDEDNFWDAAWSSTPTATNTWTDNDQHTVLLEVFDGLIKDTEEIIINVLNVAPTVDAGSDVAFDEGTAVIFAGTFSDPGSADTHTATWDWGDGSPVEAGTVGGGAVSGTHTYTDNADYVVTLTVTDDDGGVGTDTLTVTVSNVAPIIDSISVDTIDENEVATASGAFTDPGILDTFTVTIDWGEGAPETFSYPAGSLGFSETHQYLDDNPTGTPSDTYTLQVTVTDDDGDSDTANPLATVNNVNPEVDAGTDQTVNEGEYVFFDGSFTDVGTQDLHTIQWDFGDGTMHVIGSLTPAHAYADDGTYLVTLTVWDDDTGTNSDSVSITVNNVAPTITSLTSDQPNPQFVLPDVHTIEFTAEFTDPGWLDTHTATWNYGDGTIEPALLSEENDPPYSTGTITGSHSYTTPGTYTVIVTVTDDDGGVSSDSMIINVVTVEGAVADLDAYLQGVGDSAFSKKADNQKKTLANMFSAIQDKLDAEEYQGAIYHMNTIRSFMDGEGKDWITDPEVQDHAQMKIDDIIEYLYLFL